MWMVYNSFFPSNLCSLYENASFLALGIFLKFMGGKNDIEFHVSKDTLLPQIKVDAPPKVQL